MQEKYKLASDVQRPTKFSVANIVTAFRRRPLSLSLFLLGGVIVHSFHIGKIIKQNGKETTNTRFSKKLYNDLIRLYLYIQLLLWWGCARNVDLWYKSDYVELLKKYAGLPLYGPETNTEKRKLRKEVERLLKQ